MSFIMVASVTMCMFLPFIVVKKKKMVGPINWGLGVDCCFYYSSPFSIRNRRITIAGFQEVLAGGKTIRYSVVRLNWWGKRTVYAEEYITGNDENPQYFHISLDDIPNGANYQVEVFNSFNMACGKFKVEES